MFGGAQARLFYSCVLSGKDRLGELLPDHCYPTMDNADVATQFHPITP